MTACAECGSTDLEMFVSRTLERKPRDDGAPYPPEMRGKKKVRITLCRACENLEVEEVNA